MIDSVVGILLAGVGVVLGAFRADLFAPGWRAKLWNAARVLLVAVGVAFLLGILTVHPAREGPSIRWEPDVTDGLARARSEGRLAMVDFGASWCGACKELEERTFTDPAVVAALADAVAVRVDMTAQDAARDDAIRAAGLPIPPGLPWVGFVLPDGRLNPGVTLLEFEPPERFVNRVKEAREWREAPLSPVEALLGRGGLLVALLVVFVAGLGVTLTPCVYPMIPITLTVVGRGGQADGPPVPLGARTLRSALFVLGLLVTYVTLGVVSALAGQGFGSHLQRPEVTLGMALLFAALAASYLGFFQLDLPASLKTRLGRKRGGLLSVALVGGATGLLAAPCAGPIVVGILALISQTGSVALGLVLMVSFALGMGLVFFVLGMSTAILARIPRNGAWTERVEIGFAVALLVVAIHYVRVGLGL